jgi:hypothetical protein
LLDKEIALLDKEIALLDKEIALRNRWLLLGKRVGEDIYDFFLDASTSASGSCTLAGLCLRLLHEAYSVCQSFAHRSIYIRDDNADLASLGIEPFLRQVQMGSCQV